MSFLSPAPKNADAFFDYLVTKSTHTRGVIGLVIDGGNRDVADLQQIEFPV